MKKKCIILLTFILCSSISFSQKNRLNKHGQRTGKWIVYSDSTKTIKSTEARYRKGKNVGKSYYYTNGILERKEINRFKKLKTTIYYPNGKKNLTGQARIEDLPDKIHYYFYGTWKYYDEEGKLIKYGYFEKGKLVRSEFVTKNNKPEDSLNTYLLNLDKAFYEKNEALINKINSSVSEPVRAEKYRTFIVTSDTSSFAKTERFLAAYGYPDNRFSKEAANVPFFILSYGTVAIKEKYVELLKAAATKGFLSWSTLSFYIDRLQLAKGEKQIYGTQYYIHNKQIVYFPVIDPENLSKRRALIGLE